MKAPDMGAWVDFGQLARTRTDARATGADAAARQESALRGVARQFESVFMNMMLKSMRDASFGDPLFDSSEADSYRDLFDQQLAMEMSGEGGIGIADMLVRQLSPLVRQGAAAAPGPLVDLGDRAPIVELDTPPQAATAAALPVAAGAPPSAGAIAAAAVRQDGRHSLQAVARAAAVEAPRAPAAARAVEQAARFDGPEDFVARTWPHAERVAGELGVEPAVLVAQAALETGWGRHVIGGAGDRSSHNLFGIKADTRWRGAAVTVSTLEFEGGVMRRVRAPFRAYQSLAASFDDYARFVADQPRYQGALEAARAAGGDGETYIRRLHAAGYATDPHYADKVVDVMRRTVAAVKNADTRSL